MESRRIYYWTEDPEDARAFSEAVEAFEPDEASPELIVVMVRRTQTVSMAQSLAVRYPGVPMLVLGKTEEGYAMLHTTALSCRPQALWDAVHSVLGKSGTLRLLDYQAALENAVADGALYVTYESFVSIYRFAEKLCERSRQDVQTMLLTLRPRFGETPPEEALAQACAQLGNAVQLTLRRNDVFTECGAAQMLVLLMDADDDGGHQAANRIRNTFLGIHEAALFDLAYEVGTVRSGLPVL